MDDRRFGPWTEPVALSVEIPLAIPLDRQLVAVNSSSTDGIVRHLHSSRPHSRDGAATVRRGDHGFARRRRGRLSSRDMASGHARVPTTILSDIQWQTFDSNFLAMYAASSMDGTT